MSFFREVVKLRLAMIGMVCGLLAFSLVASAANAAVPGVTDDEILIGSTTGTTGNFAAITKPYLGAAQAYFNKVNQQGGVHGRTIRWRTLDDGFNVQRAVTGARRLVQQIGIFAAALPFGTGPTIAKMEVYSQFDVPYLALGTSLAVSQGKKPGVFGITTPYFYQVRAVTNYMIEEKDMENFVGLFYAQADGGEVRDGFEAELENHGLSPVEVFLYEPGTTDFSAQMQSIKTKDVDGVILYGSVPDSARVLSAARRAGVQVPFGGPVTLADQKLIELAGDAAEGVIGASPVWLPGHTDQPGVQRYLADLKQYGEGDIPATVWGMMAYQGAQIFVEAVDRAGRDLTREKFIAAMQSIKNFETGVAGPVTYGPDDHQGGDSVIIAEVQNGEYVAQTGWITFDN